MTQSEITSTEAASPNTRSMARGIIGTLRPRQWVKNLFVLAPLFFSKSFLIPEKALLALAAALLFCAAAGTVYLFNDIFDIEKDRRHPTKRFRPIPSGELPVSVARASAAILAIATISGSFALGIQMGITVTAYLVMNFAYSFSLKNIAFLDVSIIATGFVLRLLVGPFAIGRVSSSMFASSPYFLTLLPGPANRDQDPHTKSRNHLQNSRKLLARYRVAHLDLSVLFLAGLTI